MFILVAEFHHDVAASIGYPTTLPHSSSTYNFGSLRWIRLSVRNFSIFIGGGNLSVGCNFYTTNDYPRFPLDTISQQISRPRGRSGRTKLPVKWKFITGIASAPYATSMRVKRISQNQVLITNSSTKIKCVRERMRPINNSLSCYPR